MNVGWLCDVVDACSCLMMQDNEADAGWQSVCLSAYQEPAFNYAADFHVNDAVNKIMVDNIHSPGVIEVPYGNDIAMQLHCNE